MNNEYIILQLIIPRNLRVDDPFQGASSLHLSLSNPILLPLSNLILCRFGFVIFSPFAFFFVTRLFSLFQEQQTTVVLQDRGGEPGNRATMHNHPMAHMTITINASMEAWRGLSYQHPICRTAPRGILGIFLCMGECPTWDSTAHGTRASNSVVVMAKQRFCLSSTAKKKKKHYTSAPVYKPRCESR